MAESDYFARTALLLGADAVTRLAGLRVLVVGLGGVGGWCAEALVRSGVGALALADDDRVAPSNVNRQLPATSRTLGRFKTDVLRERFAEINPAAELAAHTVRYTPESAGDFDLETFDYVVDAIDSVPCKAHLIKTVQVLRGPVLFSSMGAARRLDPTRIRTTKFTRVTGDGLARALRQRFKREGSWPARDFLCTWSDEPPRPNSGTVDGNGSFMPVTAAFGLHLAAALVRHAVTCSSTSAVRQGR